MAVKFENYALSTSLKLEPLLLRSVKPSRQLSCTCIVHWGHLDRVVYRGTSQNGLYMVWVAVKELEFELLQ